MSLLARAMPRSIELGPQLTPCQRGDTATCRPIWSTTPRQACVSTPHFANGSARDVSADHEREMAPRPTTRARSKGRVNLGPCTAPAVRSNDPLARCMRREPSPAIHSAIASCAASLRLPTGNHWRAHSGVERWPVQGCYQAVIATHDQWSLATLVGGIVPYAPVAPQCRSACGSPSSVRWGRN
jgi:hypothetical protein